MANRDNKSPNSTNIRIKLKTKKQLEAQALGYGETHDDIIARLLKQDKIESNTKKANYEDAL